MSGWRLFLVWIGCIIGDGIVGFALGFILWQLGFEILGSATALVAGVIGGTMAFFAIYAWTERRQAERRRKERAQ